MQSYWLVTHDGHAVRLFQRRSAAIAAISRALRLRIPAALFQMGLYGSALLQRGEVATPCGIWSVISVPVEEPVHE